MRELRDDGMTLKQIAAVAGVSKVAVWARLNPEKHRHHARQAYERAPGTMIEKSRSRYARQQAETLQQPDLRRGPWTDEEIAYLLARAPYDTCLQIALALHRTLAAVRYAAEKYKAPMRTDRG